MEVKAKLPELDVFVNFVVLSGLRYIEAIKAYNLIIDLAQDARLNEYFDYQTETLEHFKFKQLFIRRTKKAFISFVPKLLVARISEQQKITRAQIDNRIRRRGFSSRFGDIREYFATYMTKYLTQPEIDFLQGRVSANVFMRNYFNPALIGDLKKRVFEGVETLGRTL